MSNKLLKPSFIENLNIRAALRGSSLSKANGMEVLNCLKIHYPNVKFEWVFVETLGDKDKISSLRCLGKTDFFTKEIDAEVLEGRSRIGIHSAKDLPFPLPKGLKIVAVTKGVDPSDSLVLKRGKSLESLPSNAPIATSSFRREEAVKQLRDDLKFIDLRGNIEERLAKLQTGEAYGVVVAESALIRLNLTHLDRIKLPGETPIGQGQLAILAEESDEEMEALFAKIDSRPKVLYLGISPPEDDITAKYLPYPIIKIEPRPFIAPDIQEAFSKLRLVTHFIFTSKISVKIFFDILNCFGISKSLLENKRIIAIGQKTAQCIQDFGLVVDIIPELETTEGIIEALENLRLSKSYFFWPHSVLSRHLLIEYFKKAGHDFQEVVLYDTYPKKPGPLPEFDQLYFTSPSTVDAYLGFFGSFPAGKTFRAIGPITEQYLKNKEIVCL